jgi:hypothetical protein
MLSGIILFTKDCRNNPGGVVQESCTGSCNVAVFMGTSRTIQAAGNLPVSRVPAGMNVQGGEFF